MCYVDRYHGYLSIIPLFSRDYLIDFYSLYCIILGPVPSRLVQTRSQWNGIDGVRNTKLIGSSIRSFVMIVVQYILSCSFLLVSIDLPTPPPSLRLLWTDIYTRSVTYTTTYPSTAHDINKTAAELGGLRPSIIYLLPSPPESFICSGSGSPDRQVRERLLILFSL